MVCKAVLELIQKRFCCYRLEVRTVNYRAFCLWVGRLQHGNTVFAMLPYSRSNADFEDFMWRQRKNVLVAVIGSVSVMALTALMIQFTVLWLLATFLSFWLLFVLIVRYETGQRVCRIVSLMLILIALVSCFTYDHSSSGSGTRSSINLMLFISFACILSHAPILCLWNCSMWFLALGFVSLLGLARCDHVYPASDSGPFYNAGIATLLMCSTTVIGLLGRHSDRQLYLYIKALEEALYAAESQPRSKPQGPACVPEPNKFEYIRKLNEMRQFISYICHEIRVPFNAVVLGIGHLLASDVTSEQSEILQMMDASAQSMVRILNDVLDMGKIDAGKLHLEKQPFNLGEVVSTLTWGFRDTFESKGIAFSLHVDGVTKRIVSHHDLLGDKYRLQQVLKNFLSNAAKFTPQNGSVTLRVICDGILTTEPVDLNHYESFPEDGITAECRLCMYCKNGNTCYSKEKGSLFVKITISVEDTGIGISKKDQEKLFEPYTQIKSESVHGERGTGLGLYFSKRIVELAGGKIGVKSQLGKGSTFSLVLPFELTSLLRREENPRNKNDFKRHRSVSTNSKLSGKYVPSILKGRKPKVLLVEDDSVNRKILRVLLAKLGVDSEDAENGQKALEHCLNGSTYDMIFVDKEMPEMNGVEATRHLRSMGVTSPIIGLTGNTLESDQKQFLAAGLDELCTKPISRPRLLRLLEAHHLLVLVQSKAEKDFIYV